VAGYGNVLAQRNDGSIVALAAGVSASGETATDAVNRSRRSTHRDGATATDAASRPARRSRRARILLSVTGIVAVVIVVASFINLNEYAITPGQAISVNPLISVQRGHATAHRGAVLLADVELVPLRAIDYLFYRLNGNAQIVPKTELIGTLTPAQYNTEGVLDMASARQAATVAAFRTLGYKTSARPVGVAVYAPESHDAPASKSLAVGDVITAVDGRPTPSTDALERTLGALVPGEAAHLTVHTFGSRTQRTATVVLGAVRLGSGGVACLPVGVRSTLSYELHAGRRVPCLGIVPDELLATSGAPFAVSMNAEGIIGPSAGLAFTLGLIEKLDHADLTRGAKVAATGTMSPDGTVGDVGGVAQKTVAVRDAGASIFFVPTPELKVARAHAGPHLKVFAVANLSQAIADLERLGGRVVRPPAG
jgi:PDZ domain-containing protein